MDNECEATDGMKLEVKLSYSEKSTFKLLCTPQIQHYLTWDQTRHAAMNSIYNDTLKTREQVLHKQAREGSQGSELFQARSRCWAANVRSC
jgi:hypothetical protein